MTNWHDKHAEGQTFGDRLADKVAQGMGSWRFVIGQSAFIAAWTTSSWVVYVVCGWTFDPFPWILLNLLFSTQASYSAPIIMMSQNRQAARDRIQAEADHESIEHMKSVLANQDTELALLKQVNQKQTELLEAVHDHLGLQKKEAQP